MALDIQVNLKYHHLIAQHRFYLASGCHISVAHDTFGYWDLAALRLVICRYGTCSKSVTAVVLTAKKYETTVKLHIYIQMILPAALAGTICWITTPADSLIDWPCCLTHKWNKTQQLRYLISYGLTKTINFQQQLNCSSHGSRVLNSRDRDTKTYSSWQFACSICCWRLTNLALTVTVGPKSL